MKYNPDIHHRRSLHLKGFDYSSEGMYFVTLCTFDRGCFFEEQGIGHPQGMPLRDKLNNNKTIGDIIGAFKSLCVTEWLDRIRIDNVSARGKFWQRNFYEHVIRDEDELNRIRQYVRENPLKWDTDTENPTSCS
jgi:putative transposase